MVRAATQKTMPQRDGLSVRAPKRKQHGMPHRLHGKAGGAVRRQKSGDVAGKSLFCGFHSKEGRSEDSVTMLAGSGLYGVTEGRGSVSDGRNLIKQGLEMINVQGMENTSYLYSNVAH